MGKQTKYTKSARGQECQIRIYGICNGNPETTVFAHINGSGLGMKSLDIHGSYSCSACHDAVDGRISPVIGAGHLYDRKDIYEAFCNGMIRTQKLMVEEGILKL